MAENSKIEWTDHTFNPWIGCTKVSPACKHCYAEALDKRWGRNNWGANATRTLTGAANWKKPLQWNKQAEKEGRRYRVFCASLADVFEQHGNPQTADSMTAWRRDLWDLIESTPNLDWLLLTKRPENVAVMTPEHWDDVNWPHNVWIGTTAENQAEADKRVPELLKIPARVRFLSCEPLLGPVEMSDYFGKLQPINDESYTDPVRNGIDWVICGGESGHGARPMHPDWARSLRDQCAAAGVPFLFKQWGEWAPVAFRSPSANRFGEFVTVAGNKQVFDEGSMTHTNTSCMHFIGKKAAGRLLDGREWNQFPHSTDHGKERCNCPGANGGICGECMQQSEET